MYSTAVLQYELRWVKSMYQSLAFGPKWGILFDFFFKRRFEIFLIYDNEGTKTQFIYIESSCLCDIASKETVPSSAKSLSLSRFGLYAIDYCYKLI